MRRSCISSSDWAAEFWHKEVRARIKQSRKIPVFKKKLYKQSIAVLEIQCFTEL